MVVFGRKGVVVAVTLFLSTLLFLRETDLQGGTDHLLPSNVALETLALDGGGVHAKDQSVEDPSTELCRDLLLTWECMSVQTCLSQHKVEELLRWIPRRASESCKSLFQHWPCTATDTCADTSSIGTFTPGDIVARSQIQHERQSRPPYVKPEDRNVTPFPPPFTCSSQSGAVVTIHPLTMGAAREMFLGNERRLLFRRTIGFSNMYPKKRQVASWEPPQKPFHINDEVFALLDMAKSRFGLTTKRWGWDCLRHYEYSAYGVLPYFFDLPVAPNNSVASLPRHLLLPVLSMRGVSHNGALRSLLGGENSSTGALTGEGLHPCEYKKPFYFDGGAHVACNSTGSVDESALNVGEYERAAGEYYAYAEKYLNTASMAASVLQRAGVESARHVLLVLLQSYVEFNQISLHHGLVDLGLQVTCIPRVEGHYKRQAKSVTSVEALERERDKYLRYHGNGYMWGFRVYDDTPGTFPSLDGVTRMIEDKVFDAVIFAGFNSGRPESALLFREVTASYSSKKIIFVQTTDAPYPHGVERDWSSATTYGHFFMREVQDKYDQCPSPVAVPAIEKRLLLPRSPYEIPSTAKANCGDPLPEYMVHHEDSVVLLDGYHWGEVYIKWILGSVRKFTNATIVLLCPHNESFLSVTQQQSAAFEQYQPLVAVLFYNSTVHKDQFLFYAAKEFLSRPTSRRFSRVVVSSSLEAVWVADLFRFIGPHVYVTRAGDHRDFPEHALGDCGLSYPSAMNGGGSKLALFSHHTLAGERKQVEIFLSLIETVGGFSVCSNNAALNGVMHVIDTSSAASGDVSVVAWSADSGPVVQHDDTTCATISKVQTLCGNEKNAAVLLNRCQSIPV